MPQQVFARVLSNDPIIAGHKVLTCEAPALAALAEPGHFVNVLTAERFDPLLRKPFSIYTVDRNRGQISLLYSIVGATTEGMARKRPGETLDMVGPLGRAPVSAGYAARRDSHHGRRRLRRPAAGVFVEGTAPGANRAKYHIYHRRTAQGLTAVRGGIDCRRGGRPRRDGRRLAWDNRPRDGRSGTAAPGKIRAARDGLLLRPHAHDAGGGRTVSAFGRSLPGVDGSCHALRHRRLYGVCAGPRGRQACPLLRGRTSV